MSGTVLLHPDPLGVLAGRLQGMAGDLLLVAGTVTAVAADPELLSGAVLDPLGVAHCEAALAQLLAPAALPGCAARLGEAALRVRAVRVAALLCDDAERLAGLVQTLGAAPAHLRADAEAEVARAVPRLLAAVQAELVAHVPGIEAGVAGVGAAERLLLELEGCPERLADIAVDGQGHALGVGLDLVLGLLPEGPGSAREVPPPAGPLPPTPAGLGDLYGRIAALAPGQASVLRLGGAPPRWVVLLPGIHSLGVTDDPQDLYGALLAARRRSTAYTRAVTGALAIAGAAAGDEVMLVGHSQGGLVALDLASDAAFTAHYRVTHAVAAGSPVTGKRVAPGSGTQVLTVENRADLVPHLDLAESASAAAVPGRTVYSYLHDRGTVGGNHGVASEYALVTGASPAGLSPSDAAYAAAASAAFAADPAVARFLRSAAPYLRPRGQVGTSYFELSDRPAGPPPVRGAPPSVKAPAVPRQRRVGR